MGVPITSGVNQNRGGRNPRPQRLMPIPTTEQCHSTTLCQIFVISLAFCTWLN